MQKTKKLEAEAVKSEIITEKTDLIRLLASVLKRKKIKEKTVLAVSSKVLAITQGRIIKLNFHKDLEKAVKSEADKIFGSNKVQLTLKNHIFTPWAGIDQSNIQSGRAILWPKEPFKAAAAIRNHLKKHLKLKQLGVVIVDSFCVPLRKGVSGIALGYSGFKGVEDKRGSHDLYGNKLNFTQEAVADSLAGLANYLMGQSDEQTPFVLITNAPVIFSNGKTSPLEPVMPVEQCLYEPLYPAVMKRRPISTRRHGKGRK